MKIALVGYRSWALIAFGKLIEKFPDVSFGVYTKPNNLNGVEDTIILAAGWSWIFDTDTLKKNKFVAAMHPSDLPQYAGGSPIQHQIVDGVTKTKATLFEATENIDGGPILYKTDMSLEGHMPDIFNSLTKVTIELFSKFILDWPNIPKQTQEQGDIYKRLTPDSSKLSIKDVQNMSVLDLYNYIRCREDPYPNVYVEDDSGKLYFRNVEFENE
tara:strand:- start:8298 stop:8939 length:642 start_codon:yes stop_codon:yes gene_type:complete